MKQDEKYDELSNAKKNEFHSTYNVSDLFLSDYDSDDVFVPPLEGYKKVSLMPPLVFHKKLLIYQPCQQ